VTTIRLGTCSFADEGLLKAWYPRGVSTSRARLRYYAERFDTTEVDSPYYHLPDPGVTRNWAQRTPPEFTFHVKAHASMTWHQGEPTDTAFVEFRASIKPLELSGKLRGILMQYHPRFTKGAAARAELERLPERLHHFGFVVKDQEVNRQFFEEVLGIPLIATWCERAHNVIVGREINYCHTFYALADGGALAFFQFEDADAYEALKAHRPDVGHHFAMKVDQKTYDDIGRRLNAAKIQYRETDHGYCQSIYMASPDGLKVEFTAHPPDADEIAAYKKKDAHSELKRWLAGDRRPNNTDRHGVTG